MTAEEAIIQMQMKAFLACLDETKEVVNTVCHLYRGQKSPKTADRIRAGIMASLDKMGDVCRNPEGILKKTKRERENKP